MIIGVKDYLSDELKLILNNVNELFSKTWSTTKLRSYGEGDVSVLDELWRALVDFGLFEFFRDAKPRDAAILMEEVSSRLPPGIVVTTIIGAAATGNELGDEKYEGRLKISISNIAGMAPEAHRADAIIIGDNLIWKDDATVKPPLNSFDNSMKLCQVSFRRSTKVSVNRDLVALLLSAAIVGTGKPPLELSVDYAKKRIAFGRPIGAFQAVKHKLVNMALNIELARSLYLRAADDLKLAPMALDYASRVVPNTIRDSIQVHGGV
ncbi:acyl-CoA dehydrogenase family protein [Vulcanisaeta distributa]|uniref:acyl-CoA dehydrogenase family protein n=1 Tax=Vulcanisaeta distributa TaxID=164451 RepID=UPI0006D171BA|nr:acyl-CoA dehydrogenase family protein [Vulcanisaeta distributa]